MPTAVVSGKVETVLDINVDLKVGLVNNPRLIHIVFLTTLYTQNVTITLLSRNDIKLLVSVLPHVAGW